MDQLDLGKYIGTIFVKTEPNSYSVYIGIPTIEHPTSFSGDMPFIKFLEYLSKQIKTLRVDGLDFYRVKLEDFQ